MLTPEFIGMLKNVKESYEIKCRVLCKELNMSQTALDILLIVSDEKIIHTAREIGHIIDLKPNLISTNVEKLVQGGYLERKLDEKDRRVIHLISTQKSRDIYRRGKEIQIEYLRELGSNITKDEFEIFVNCLKKINDNALNMMSRK